MTEPANPGTGERRPFRIGRLIGIAAAIGFVLTRLPMMYREPAGEDEDYYAVPGLTILQSGVPRLPHVPARNPESVYYRADEALFAEPPLSFYWQAAFYAVFPKTLGTARLSSAIAGILVLWSVFRIARHCGCSETAAGLTCLALSISRWFYFPAVRTRPDVLCVLLGLVALLVTWRWIERRRSGDLILIGFLIGLGGLTHPIALVYATQIAVWLSVSSQGARKATVPLLVAAIAILTTALWLPLIAAYPEAFKTQFQNQFLSGSNGSILKNLIWPWESLAYHGKAVVWYLGQPQCGIVAGAILGGAIVARHAASPLRSAVWLAITAFFLTAVLVGPHHRVFGYFLYPAALSFVLLARTGEALTAWAATRGLPPLASCFGMAAAMAAVLLPGSGLRQLTVHLRHWNDANYDVREFSRNLLRSLPRTAVCIVDTPFVVEFVADGRNVLLAQTLPFYFRVQDFPADYLVFSRQALRDPLLMSLPADVMQTFGDESQPNACYAVIYRRR